MLIDGPGLLALAAVLGAVVYYVFFRDVRLTRRMKPLVEMLDAGTARLEGGRLSGAYSGKRVWFEYRAQSRAGPAAMRIGVACAASHSFRIHKKAESLGPAERACLENEAAVRVFRLSTRAIRSGTRNSRWRRIAKPRSAGGSTGPTRTRL